MKLFRLHFAFCFLLLAVLSAPAQFVLHLSPVSPGSAQLQFMRASSYYYLLEESADLKAGFTAASGWMLGDDGLVTWPIHYNVSPPSSGGSGGTVLVDTFALYPFNNGKTLVTWSDIAGTMYRVLVVQDYSTLPPLVSLPGSATVSSLLLLVGDLAWNFSYETLDPALLPQEQQSVLAHLTSRRAEILAAVSGSNSGQGVYVASQKHFFRIQRVESDADGDGLDWAMETFILGTNPDEVDSDGDGYEDSIEIARGTDPTDPFDGIAPVITVVDGDGQLAWVGQFDDSPIIVRVANAEGRAIPNHKVVFSAPIAAFAANNLPTTAVSATYEAVTDDTGYAYVFFRQPGTKRTTTSIHAQVRGKAHNSTADRKSVV